MSTVTEIEQPAAPDSFAGRVAGVIRALAAAQGKTQTDVARAMGISKTAVGLRWSGRRPWQLGDLEQVAPMLGTTPAALCDVDRWNLWAPRGSNPQPTDYESAPLATVLAFRRSGVAA